MKTKSKAFLLVMCMVLLIVASIMGTFSYLTSQTGKVTNTFVVGNMFDGDDPTPDDGPFVLYEHEATDANEDGVYELGTTEVTANTYKVLPGVDLPKDPFVRTDVALGFDAYVFVEVVDNTGAALAVAVDDAWTKLDEVTGPHGGAVYVLENIAQAGSALAATSILEGNKIAVADAEITNPGTVDFYGYLIQTAGFENSAAAWTAIDDSVTPGA